MLNNNALELAVADAGLQGQQVFVPDSVCFDNSPLKNSFLFQNTGCYSKRHNFL